MRNNSEFYFAKYDSKSEMVDDYGNVTGQYELKYSKPIKVQGNVSAAKGEIQNRQFGESESYDKVIVLDNRDIQIDEYSILWVDNPPLLADDGGLVTDENGDIVTPHDYIVKRVARSLNSVSIAISKVRVDG